MHIDELETPTLLVDLRKLEANIHRMANYCKQHRINLRTHVNSHKSPMIAYKQIAIGAYSIACQKLSEAEIFADAGFTDILITHSMVGWERFDRLMQLAERISISVTTDSGVVVERISQAAKTIGRDLPILIQIDTGEKRRVTQTPQAIVALGKRIIDLPHVELAGMMMSPISPACRSYLLETLDRFESADVPIQIVSGISTQHAFQIHEIPEITELCAGNYVFNDLSHVYWKVCDLADCALTVLTTVVSTQAFNRVILDAGMKTLTMTHWTSHNLSHDHVYGAVQDCPDATVFELFKEGGHLKTENTSRQFKVEEKAQVIPVNSAAAISMNDTFALVKDDRVLEILPISA